jgi:hypothetical protein
MFRRFSDAVATNLDSVNVATGRAIQASAWPSSKTCGSRSRSLPRSERLRHRQWLFPMQRPHNRPLPMERVRRVILSRSISCHRDAASHPLGQPPVSLADHYAIVISGANRLGSRRGIPCKRLTPGALKSYFRRAATDIERVRLGNCRRTGSPSLC